MQVDDFGAQLCPGGAYTTSFDGIQIRDGDGVHIVPDRGRRPVARRPGAARGGQGGPPADGRRQLCRTAAIDHVTDRASTSSTPPTHRLGRPGRRPRVPELGGAGSGLADAVDGQDERAGGGIDDGGGGWLKTVAGRPRCTGPSGPAPGSSPAPGCSPTRWSSGPATDRRGRRPRPRWGAPARSWSYACCFNRAAPAWSDWCPTSFSRVIDRLMWVQACLAKVVAASCRRR